MLCKNVRNNEQLILRKIYGESKRYFCNIRRQQILLSLSQSQNFEKKTMAITRSFSLPKLKKGLSGATNQQVSERGAIMALLEYHIFLQALMKEVNAEARSKKSKGVKREHIRAVGKRVLQRFKP